MSASESAAPAATPVPPPPGKPPARASRISLFLVEMRERLAGAAVDLLFARARVLSEGGRATMLPLPDGTRGPDPFFGSTMITVDLGDLTDAVREPPEPVTAGRVAALLAGDASACRRAREVAAREACRVAGERVDVAASEVRVRAVGATVHLDVDLEGWLGEGTPPPARARAQR